jgi:hypothetical protein
MAQDRKSLQEAMAESPHRGQAPPPMDQAIREAIARESADRYQQFVAKLNRTSDSEMDQALRAPSSARTP